MKTNPYRFFQKMMDAWPLWAGIMCGWFVAYVVTQSAGKATWVVLEIIAGIFVLGALMIGWCLLEAWLRDQADTWDERVNK